jgi:hypothetical protein
MIEVLPIEELASLYRRKDGTMRQCNRNPSRMCIRHSCHIGGCFLATHLLKHLDLPEETKDEDL